MTPLHAILLGIIEGVTEFLPISSTGHLILAQAILHIPETPFAKVFDIVIQLAAIAAVFTLYIQYLWTHKHVWAKLLVAFIPTGIIGFVLYKIVKQFFLGNVPLVIASLFVGGIALIMFDRLPKKHATVTMETLPISKAFLIGLVQALSIIPGVSRAAATIIGGVAVGLPREDAVLFSFLLAIPTMAAASGYDVLKNYQLLTTSNLGILLLGMGVSYITAWIAVRTFIRYVQRHSLASFGIYRVVLALVLSVLLLWKV